MKFTLVMYSHGLDGTYFLDSSTGFSMTGLSFFVLLTQGRILKVILVMYSHGLDGTYFLDASTGFSMTKG